MQFRLTANLGLNDVRKCNRDLGASLSTDPADVAAGSIVTLPERAAEYLQSRYKSLLEPVNIKGVAKDVELKGK